MLIVRLAVLLVPAKVAVITAFTVLVTAKVVTVKVANFVPAGTSTVAGTDASLLLLVNETETPPAGAAVPNVTVPLEVLPPTNDAGLSDRPDTTGGLMVKVVVASTVPPDLA